MALTNYRPDIDGLRAVAVLAVVLHHLSTPLMPGGYVGVDVFFVISGFLITSIISREMADGRFTFIRFYERRARRLFPALFAMLGATLVTGYVLLLPSDMVSALRGTLGTLLFSSNMVFWRDMALGYFAATDAMLNPVLHTWSLAVEEQFYVFFPILLLLSFRFARQHIVPILIVCAVVSLAGAALLVQSKSMAVFFLSPFRAWELLVGALLAFNIVPPLQSRMVREVTASVGLLAIVAACFVYDAKTTFPGLMALAPVLGAGALIHAGSSGPSIAGRLLQWGPIVYVGLISYSLYLWHWPLIVYTRYAVGMEPLTPYIPALLAASLLLGSLSYHFVEQPFRRGKGLDRKLVFTSAAALASVLGLAAVVGLMRGGFEARFSPEVVNLDKARSPQVAYADCEDRPIGAWCSLGSRSTAPQTMLWGDSHMLAWGPALHRVFEQRGEGAFIAWRPLCPPLFGIQKNSANPSCPDQNTLIKNHLLAHPEIKTVIMAAHWNVYFRDAGPLTVGTGRATTVEGTAAIRAGLAASLEWLLNNGRQVILIGPVPTFDKSVPLAQALGVATNRNFLHSTAQEQRDKNAPFFQVVNVFHGAPSFRFLDPIQWMCAGDCITMKNGVPLYRDAHHLSIAGAIALETDLAHGMGFLPAFVQMSEQSLNKWVQQEAVTSFGHNLPSN